MFNLFKKNKSENPVPWRNKNGKIACNGDGCVLSKCTDECPIWLQTIAAGLVAIKQYDKAIQNYKQAVSIAPDFDEAWNNLGMAYGYCSDYENARRAYAKALELKPNKKYAIYGLALANRDLGNYEEALRFCDMYDEKIHTEGIDNLRASINEVRASIEEKINAWKVKTKDNSKSDMELKTPTKVNKMDLLQEMFKRGSEAGYVKEGEFPNVPEIMAIARDTSFRIIKASAELQDEKDDDEFNPVLADHVWCAYAGIGSVMLWRTNWPKLRENGVFDILVNPRGIDEMDEEVLDIIGVTFLSDEERALRNHLYDVAFIPINEFTSIECEDLIKRANNYLTSCETMFLYGMVIQLNALGMH